MSDEAKLTKIRNLIIRIDVSIYMEFNIFDYSVYYSLNLVNPTIILSLFQTIEATKRKLIDELLNMTSGPTLATNSKITSPSMYNI